VFAVLTFTLQQFRLGKVKGMDVSAHTVNPIRPSSIQTNEASTTM